MRRRQYVEEHHPQIFCKEEFAERLLADLERMDLEQLDRDDCSERFYQFVGIVALSFAWIRGDGHPPDPDPDGMQLKALLGSSSGG
mmetsp:Transcript_15235/g.36111  ORF Transcript_15235/g.36111 Transcript_15235/m.36111 type:complete len:86 (+) Transcript_15235:550-807(+)